MNQDALTGLPLPTTTEHPLCSTEEGPILCHFKPGWLDPCSSLHPALTCTSLVAPRAPCQDTPFPSPTRAADSKGQASPSPFLCHHPPRDTQRRAPGAPRRARSPF